MHFLKIFDSILHGSFQSAMIETRTLGPGQVMTWTGTGFMRVLEGDSITFVVDKLPKSMEYDIVIRYESQVCTKKLYSFSVYKFTYE